MWPLEVTSPIQPPPNNLWYHKEHQQVLKVEVLVEQAQPPHFDGISYAKWKSSMREYLMAVNAAFWNFVSVGITFPPEDATLSQDQALDFQHNYQALHLIKSSLCAKEFDKVDGLQSAKEVWDTLFINHQGT
uniref:Retrotransposon Copia-like N-terminal domain-containing protein n=1 Tax=Setaria viridis TaxID=4556 RepID=A0A4U6UXA3_SETVI|nr:hypothetical protein SEVIR_4G054200v2 [Setaria viridis]